MKTNKDRHILSVARKSPAWTLVSGDIRFVWIFGQVLYIERRLISSVVRHVRLTCVY